MKRRRRRRNMSPTIKMKATRLGPEEIFTKLSITVDAAISKMDSIAYYLKMVARYASVNPEDFDKIKDFKYFLEDLYDTAQEYLTELEGDEL